MNRLRFRSLKRQALLLYIYSLIRVVCFKCLRSTQIHTHTRTHTRFQEETTMDSCVIRADPRKSKGKSLFRGLSAQICEIGEGGKNIKGKRTILTAFHDIKSFFEPLERRRSRAKREQHSRYSWKFENVSVTRLFCTSLHTHTHTYIHTLFCKCCNNRQLARQIKRL